MHQPAARDDAGHRTATGPASVTVAQLAEFDEIIDVRSEGEFAEDHIPGAINCPVLDDAERVRVGTIYKQVSSFEAKKIGAALVSRNIARHIEDRFLDRPRSWRPLVYCWRGGTRSGAFAQVLQQIGWRVGRLEGGYKAYRREVIADLQTLPARLRWRAVCGLTGCGKSRLLAALAGLGAQVLDLEGLAAHRGSVLGTLPDAPQPTQKMFETLIWNVLRGFSPARPAYVEAESRKIGDLRVPESLIACMWQSECVRLEAGVGVRIALLKQEYTHFLDDPQALMARLEILAGLYGHAVIHRWKMLARAGRWDELVEDLLGTHYDPAYTRSTLKHYPRYAQALVLKLEHTGDDAFAALARRCLGRDG
ncbi:MAG: tRNA 2-selenouridine(34) synthase MnmH [Betaproteobacteria bacterium]|nr:tRNA 2-selenouridine(34) synthase MnmH [Betaproteobacteria bacterium]MBI3938811.1 tRNA 2-selenouridine(34) synthase MnmH [Betaproteobacteria bacterium]